MNLLGLFKDQTIGSVWPIIYPTISSHLNTTIRECLQTLQSRNILSTPVLDENQRLVAFVDVLDILLYITRLVPSSVNWNLASEQQYEQFKSLGRQFDETPLKEVVEYCKLVLLYDENIFKVKKTTKIIELLDIFQYGVHRVPVMSEDGLTVEGLLSQTDLLTVISQCMHLLDKNERAKSLIELGIEPRETLISMYQGDKVINVIRKMSQTLRKPVSAVPLVDADGKLVANFSASNLKGITQHNFEELLLPAIEFLKRQSSDKAFSFHALFESSKSLHPVICTVNSSFQDVVYQLTTNRVHRLWMVDREEKPIGFVSMTDVFKALLPFSPVSST